MAELTVTKKVRLDAPTAIRLKRLANRMKTTESDVMRKALANLDAIEDREDAIRRLQELLGPEPPKERHRFQ